MRMLLAVLLLVAQGSTVRAQPSSPRDRNPAVAAGLSIGLTIAGAGMMGAASYRAADDPTDGAAALLGVSGLALVALGPTSGHIYAGRAWSPGLRWRLITIGTFMLGLTTAVACGQCSETNPLGLAGLGIMAASAVGHVGAMVYEMADAPGATRRANQRVRLRASERAWQVHVVPAIRGGFGASAFAVF